MGKGSSRFCHPSALDRFDIEGALLKLPCKGVPPHSPCYLKAPYQGFPIQADPMPSAGTKWVGWSLPCPGFPLTLHRHKEWWSCEPPFAVLRGS